MSLLKSQLSSEKGQSLIEFIFCISFSIGLIIMFISLAFNMTVGHIVHYATFMAGRVYLVSEDFSNANPYEFAEENAQKIFDHTIKAMFKVTGSTNVFMKTNGPPTLEFNRIDSSMGESERTHKIFTGPFFRFTQKLILPAIGSSRTLNMVSEAFLGKEPTRLECLKRLQSIIKTMTTYMPGTVSHVTFYDDGC